MCPYNLVQSFLRPVHTVALRPLADSAVASGRKHMVRPFGCCVLRLRFCSMWSSQNWHVLHACQICYQYERTWICTVDTVLLHFQRTTEQCCPRELTIEINGRILCSFMHMYLYVRTCDAFCQQCHLVFPRYLQWDTTSWHCRNFGVPRRFFCGYLFHCAIYSLKFQEVVFLLAF